MGAINQGIEGSAGKEQYSTQGGTSQVNYNPADVNAIRGQAGQLGSQVGGQNAMLSSLANRFSAPGQNFNYNYSTNAGLNSNFQAPQLSPELGAAGQQMLSNSLGQSRLGLGTTLGQIQQNFGQNQGLSNILQSQAKQQSQLNENPLAFQAKQAENQAAVTQTGLNNQAMQSSNDARLQNAQFQNQGIGLQNQTLASNLGQAAGLGQQGVQNSNAFLQALQQMGGMFGQTQTTGNTSQASPGWLATMGNNAGIKTFGSNGLPIG